MTMSKGLALAVGAWAIGFSSVAWALPVLDAKDAAVSIAMPDEKTMSISSTTDNNVIRWVDFSVAGGESREKVAFDGNNYLNYVTGHARSEILGTLTGGGDIYIVNPNGILIGDGATVNVGKLYLSTRELEDVRFDAFTAHGTSPIQYGGDVVNLGKLNATEISVEGNVIKFKNVADVQAETISVAAKTETRVGYAEGETDPANYENLATAHWFKLLRDEGDLQNMELNGDYMLERDMEVTGSFQPIGGSTGKYTGRFDGLGYRVDLKKIVATGNRMGLFSAIDTGGVVENVGVITSEMEFPATGSTEIYVGGVAGYNKQGTIQNVWHSGDIRINKTSEHQYVGGIVGCNDSGVITSACNIGDIAASGATKSAHIGGIAGNQKVAGQEADALIKNVYNTGMVKAFGVAIAGGVLGTNVDGYIRNVYNLGSVSASSAGGIVGRNNKYENSDGGISYAYHASGSITGTNRGAIVGVRNSTGTFSHVLFETKDAAGNALNDAKVAAGGKESLKTVQTFLNDGWDISAEGGAGTTWRIYDGQSMPLLTAFLEPKDNIGIVEEDGTRPPGTYFVTPSTQVSEQLRVLRYGDTTIYGKGYDYVSDVTCVVPKNGASATEPVEETIPADTKPSADTKPFADTKPSADTKPFVDTKSPTDTKFPTDTKSPVAVGTPPAAKAPLDTEGNLSEQEMIAVYATGKEYADEIAALQHPKQEEWGTVPAAMGTDTDKLVILGSGVRLPDGMSEEELEEMLREKA